MYMKMEAEKSGVIKGESVDSEHKEEIDVLSWSFGVSQSGTMHAGGGGGSGRANFQDISVTAWYETSTNVLMKLCATGEHVKTAKLTVRKAGGQPVEYIIYEFKEAIVSSISTGGSSGEDRLTVNFTLNFREFETKYVPQKEDGTGDTPINFGYNIAESVVTAG
jgi:type VI secretion system secreted protein Hcp